MSRPDKQAYDPSDADKRDLIGLIPQGRPLLGKGCVIRFEGERGAEPGRPKAVALFGNGTVPRW